MSYKNCNWCEWMGWNEDGLFPDGQRCPLCKTPWDAKEKSVKPKPTPFKRLKEVFS